MFARQILFLITVLALGCSPNTPENGSTGGITNGAGSDTKGALLQTVEGSGFSVQVPASWTVLPPMDSGVAIASPFDLAKGTAGVPVSINILPGRASVTPADMAAALLQSNRAIGVVESETQIQVAGRDATRLVHTMANDLNGASDDVSIHRMIRVFVPLEAGVLAVQIQGPDADVKSIMPQLDAMIESIKLK
jgi:hypothetical protein